MSEKQLKAFLEQIKADVGLQRKLNGTDLGSVQAIAHASGLIIHVDDSKKTEPLLSEMELEGMAGGGNTSPYTCHRDTQPTCLCNTCQCTHCGTAQ